MEYFSNLCCYPNYINEDEEILMYSLICSRPTRIREYYAEEWTFEENKQFEKALALHGGLNYSVDLFLKIALNVPGKTVGQIREHLQLLVKDVKFIEAYGADPITVTATVYGPTTTTNFCKTTTHKLINQESTSRSTRHKSSSVVHHHQQKKKGTRWTKEEHEKFVVGLSKYGKGDWRSISRNIVLTKTPTQVASHAQKYFIRLAKLSSTDQHPRQYHHLPTAQPPAQI